MDAFNPFNLVACQSKCPSCLPFTLSLSLARDIKSVDILTTWGIVCHLDQHLHNFLGRGFSHACAEVKAQKFLKEVSLVSALLKCHMFSYRSIPKRFMQQETKGKRWHQSLIDGGPQAAQQPSRYCSHKRIPEPIKNMACVATCSR